MQWRKNTLAEIRIIKGFVAIAFFNTFNAFGFEFPRAKPEDMGMSSDRLKRVSAKIQEYIDDDLTPGVETIIVRNGHIVYHKVQGNKRVESNTPLMKNDIFRVASMTKPIASVALMTLWEEGKFQLNDPITKFLPEFETVMVSSVGDASGNTGELVPPDRMITVRDLLTHTAGFANSYRGNKKAYREAMGPDRVVDNKELISR